jgi:hypothetical protein
MLFWQGKGNIQGEFLKKFPAPAPIVMLLRTARASYLSLSFIWSYRVYKKGTHIVSSPRFQYRARITQTCNLLIAFSNLTLKLVFDWNLYFYMLLHVSYSVAR